MRVLFDSVMNFIAGNLALIFGSMWGFRQYLLKQSRLRKARRFWQFFVTETWQFFANDTWQLVIGQFPTSPIHDLSGSLAVGDAIGLSELQSYLELLSLQNYLVAAADRLTDAALNTNLILVGRPDTNRVTQAILHQIPTTLQFQDAQDKTLLIRDLVTHQLYGSSPVPDEQGVIQVYGMIIKTPSPFAPHQLVLLLTGNCGYGTWAAVRFTKSKQFIEQAIVAGGRAIECLVAADLVDGTPQNIRLITLRPLKERAAD